MSTLFVKYFSNFIDFFENIFDKSEKKVYNIEKGQKK